MNATIVKPPEDEYSLESLEMCDGCGPHIRAVWLVFIGDGILTFCGSCYRKYKAARLAKAVLPS